MSELTPTQRVQAQLEKRYHQTDCDLKWKDTVKLLNDLAAELERVKEELKQQTDSHGITVSHCYDVIIERDDLRRKNESVKIAVRALTETLDKSQSENAELRKMLSVLVEVAQRAHDEFKTDECGALLISTADELRAALDQAMKLEGK